MLVPLAALAQADDLPGPDSAREFPTPAYLPRSAFVGTYVNGAVTPQLRFQWELTLIQRRVPALVVVREVGGGAGSVLPPPPRPPWNRSVAHVPHTPARVSRRRL